MIDALQALDGERSSARVTSTFKRRQWTKRRDGGGRPDNRDAAQAHSVTVEHNVSLTGRSGAVRQIDVLIRHKQGLIEQLVVVECKYWNSSVERLHVRWERRRRTRPHSSQFSSKAAGQGTRY